MKRQDVISGVNVPDLADEGLWDTRVLARNEGEVDLDWKVSLHGGHSGQYCEHASGLLTEMLDAAVDFGYRVFGVSEHAPRVEERFLYPEEAAKGYDCARLMHEFEQYAEAVHQLARVYADRMTVLCGFEAEVVPAESYATLMRELRERFGLEYVVGSVHYVEDFSIDGIRTEFEKAVAAFGGLESLAVGYYQAVEAMIVNLRPEVVGHFDLIRRNARGPVDTPRVRTAAFRALETVRRHDCILDLNTAGYRKGLGSPYPAPWVVEMAASMGIAFCFGDDSHSPSDVGTGLEEARHYLIENGVTELTILDRVDGRVAKRRTALAA